jgi:crotonobetainyl-CoA:carnitine CoA-transferase CaiB-like acyl-CoA transferase
MTSSPPTPAAGAAGVLAGLRVLDLSRVLAGPLCTQLLADHGADVIKVEAPAGDETRRWGPPFVSASMSSYYSGLNRNKSNISLDLTSAAGQRVLRDLIDNSDVLVENFKPGTLAQWGFDDELIASRYPRLIHCRISGFGNDGPMGGMPGYDAVAQAYAGLMSINGSPDGPPMRVGVPIVDMVTATYAFSGILLALLDQRRTGLGQLIDCALLDTAVSLLHPHSSAFLADGRVPVRTGSAHPSVAPYDTFDASDGLIFIGAATDKNFRDLTAALGVPELAHREEFATNADRATNYRVLRPLLAAPISRLEREALARELLGLGVPATAVHNVAEALVDPQVRHREMVVAVDGYQGIGIPIKLGRTPGSVRSGPRERGGDTRAVLAGLGYPQAHIDQLIDDDVAY